MSWPFPEPEDSEAIVLGRILRGESPIRLVTHDTEEEGGGWQFLDGGHVFEHDAEVLPLAEAVRLDPTVLDLADLPPGWHAWRAAGRSSWHRAEGDPPLTLPGDER